MIKRLVATAAIICVVLTGCASPNQSVPRESSSSGTTSQTSQPQSQPQPPSSSVENPKGSTPVQKPGSSSPSSTISESSSQPSSSPQNTEIEVYITITCRKAVEGGYENISLLYPDGTILGRTKLTLPKGSTCYDAIKKACDENKILFFGSKSYISAIAGVKEKDCGGASGWKYSVGGKFVMKPLGGCVLSDQDEILWGYSIDGMGM